MSQRETDMKTFVALYMGWLNAPPADMGQEALARGMAAWGDWMSRHAADIVDAGGPLGRTLKASAQGVADTRNAITGYVVVRAETHEAAARMFEGHPHFTLFPGESVEIMERLPLPQG
jgi:hypothetical protein